MCWNLYCIDLKMKVWNSSTLWISWNLAIPPQDAWRKSCRFYFWVLLTDCAQPGFHTDSLSLSLFCVGQDKHSSLTYSASSCTFLFWISNFRSLQWIIFYYKFYCLHQNRSVKVLRCHDNWNDQNMQKNSLCLLVCCQSQKAKLIKRGRT